MRSKIFILFLGVIFASVAQRRVTPVDPTAKREIVPVQTDSVVAEPEEPEIKGYLYPLFNGLSVNVNILDGIANLFGQSYGNYEIAAELVCIIVFSQYGKSGSDMPIILPRG